MQKIVKEDLDFMVETHNDKKYLKIEFNLVKKIIRNMNEMIDSLLENKLSE